MPTIQEAIEKNRIIQQARSNLRKEDYKQLKQRSTTVVKKSVGIAKNVVNKARLIKQPFKKSYQISRRTKPKIATSSALIKTFTPQRTASSPVANRPVGRPRNVYVHISPFTRQPIPAPQYYKELRLFRRQQQVFAQKNMEARMAQLAKQGINPQQVQQMQATQQMPVQQFQPQQQQFQQRRIPPINNAYTRQYPQNQVQMQPHHSRVWQDNRFVDNDWTAFGVKQVVRGGPESFWN